ncbi:MAG: DUF2589 domain-containing protein [Firmicutes bacterium]|nr:DUF2589 domain-containing protein [Bacillota bacterium]
MSFTGENEFSNYDGENAQTLSDIARGIQHCVNSTMEIMEQQYLRILSRHFDENSNPKLIRMKTPNGYELEAPSITLLSPKEIALEEMIVEMSVRVDQIHSKKVKSRGNAPELSRSSFMVSLAPKQPESRPDNVINIMMKFKAGDPPEGVSRVIEEFARQILPKRVAPPESPGGGPGAA